MTDPQVSPISQLLYTLGITREDLSKRSDQMRQFLTTDEGTPSRVRDRDNGHRSRSSSDLRSRFRSSSTSSSMARSMSRTSSNSFRDSTPPMTPIKSEAHENGFPSRQYDSMEMVIERQRRQNKRERKSRREKERELAARSSIPNPPSPSPSNASSQPSVNLDSFMQSRDDKRAQNIESDDTTSPNVAQPTAPVTPQKNKYYREHTEINAASSSHKDTAQTTETPTAARTISASNTQTTSHYQYYPYSVYGTYQPLPAVQSAQNTSTNPVTPQTRRTNAKAPARTKEFKSPLPPSSPPPPSPTSSPVRPVNLVSSPGPIGPAPKEEEYDKLPYTLPPGPYSSNKPDLSYAALVGQAILSSPEHRLTLQEIYDWITIVYPHFKRGETTWMNSIRHVLSTTVCFRKVPRDRSVGRTQWAIWDEDLECFKGGGFRKHLCKDYMKEVAAKEKQTKGKTRARKRNDPDDVDSRRPKRARKDQPSSPVMVPTPNQYPSQSFAPLFPPTRPTIHHQPYYQSCISQPQTLPADVIFPPLPAASAFNRVLSQNAARNDPLGQGTSESSSSEARDTSPSQAVPGSSSSTPTSSASSVPGLTPNRHSSSSPSMPTTSDMDIDGPGDAGAVYQVVDFDSQQDDGEQLEDVLPLSGSTTLKPVRFWGDQTRTSTLEPGINLLSYGRISDEDEDELLKSKSEGQRVSSKMVPPVPSSPTPTRRVLKSGQELGTDADLAEQPSTPTLEAPSTPPSRQLQISSVRTPISHKGLHMSPSASLAHYKSNLDPPPALSFEQDQGSNMDRDSEQDPLRTPRKRKQSNEGPSGNPVTPRKFILNMGAMDSPFRTPNGLGASPFPAAHSRSSIFDPQDPRTLLDDELNRMGALSDSPVGLFGKSRGSLLYDSPGALDSPGKYRNWW